MYLERYITVSNQVYPKIQPKTYSQVSYVHKTKAKFKRACTCGMLRYKSATTLSNTRVQIIRNQRSPIRCPHYGKNICFCISYYHCFLSTNKIYALYKKSKNDLVFCLLKICKIVQNKNSLKLPQYILKLLLSLNTISTQILKTILIY